MKFRKSLTPSLLCAVGRLNDGAEAAIPRNQIASLCLGADALECRTTNYSMTMPLRAKVMTHAGVRHLVHRMLRGCAHNHLLHRRIVSSGACITLRYGVITTMIRSAIAIPSCTMRGRGRFLKTGATGTRGKPHSERSQAPESRTPPLRGTILKAARRRPCPALDVRRRNFRYPLPPATGSLAAAGESGPKLRLGPSPRRRDCPERGSCTPWKGGESRNPMSR